MEMIDKIANDLKLDTAYINRIISRSSFYYRNYTIKRRNGKDRYVSQPSPELKTLQYWVSHNIFQKLPVSKAAFAYKKGDSIKKHAQFHRKSRYVFHTDICDFFGSIHSSHLNDILKENNKIFDELKIDTDSAMQNIEKICFRKDSLCIGAVSSPLISNIIMNSFDTILMDYCQGKNYIYSRYADDIYISSNNYISDEIINYLSFELSKMGFKINLSKTRFYSPKYKRKITGIVLTDEHQISIGTKRRTEIRKMVYDKLVHGKGDPEKIIGHLSFLKDIEPHTYNNLIIKYSKYCDEDIIVALNK